MPIAGCYEDRVPSPRSWREGIVARLANDEAAAPAALTTARSEAAKLAVDQSNYADGLSVLGMADAALGHNEDASRRPSRRRAFTRNKRFRDWRYVAKELGSDLCVDGEKHHAFEPLSTAAKLLGVLSYGELRLHSNWDPLRSDARFEKIVASVTK